MAQLLDEQKKFNARYKELASESGVPFIGRILQRTARVMPNRTALEYEDSSLSYAHLYYYATRLSRKLQDLGVQPRDRVILLYENAPEFYIGYFGILQIGAVVVPLNTFLQEKELAHILDDAQPKLIITSSTLVAAIKNVATERSIPCITENDMGIHEQPPAVLTHFDVHDIPADEMAALLYTSGTTGTPKGVMLSSKNMLTNALQGIVRFEPTPDDRVFAVLPLFHSFAQNTCVWAPMLIGCTVILVPKIDRRAILKGLAKKPTIMLGVPALYGLLCLMKTAPLEKVRIFVSGGDALPDRIRAAFSLIYRRKLCNGYGLTEASPLISGDVTDELTSAATVGNPVVGISCLFKDDNGMLVPTGQVGQLWVKGDNIMLGYYRAPEQTKDILHDSWLSTGDLAYLDAKGRIVITGRYKDLIIHKGFNIYPQEIENILLLHPQVLRAAVIGKHDAVHGEIPIAFIQTKEDDPSIAKQLEALCTKNLAAYKVPRQFICSSDPLETTATGKVNKTILKKRLQTDA